MISHRDAQMIVSTSKYAKVRSVFHAPCNWINQSGQNQYHISARMTFEDVLHFATFY